MTGSNASTITSAPSPVISVGQDGCTFSSPSAYLIYSGLSAIGGGGTRLGPVINNLTLSYAPGELSTVNSCDLPSGLSALIPPTIKTQVVNFQDFNIPPRWSVIDNHMNCDYCGQRYQYNTPQHSGDELVTDYASMDFGQIHWLGNGSSSWTLEPTIAHPSGVTDADPMWKECTSLFWGVWDPPRALSPVAAVSPNDPTYTVDPTIITPDPQVQSSTKAIAQPASGVKSMNGLPIKTSAPALSDPGSHTQIGSASAVDPKVVPDRHTVMSDDPAATREPASKLAQAWTFSVPASSSEVDQAADPGADPASTVHMPKIIFPGQRGARASDSAAATHPKAILQSKGTEATYAADPHGNGVLETSYSQPMTVVAQTDTSLGASAVIGDGTMVSVGDQVMTMQDIGVSLGSSGLQIGSTVVAIPKAGSHHTASQGITPEQSSITTGSKTFTLLGNGQLVSDGVTLAQGSSATIVDGKTMSIKPPELIIGSSTIPLRFIPSDSANIITIASKPFTFLGNGQVIGDGVTLTQGSSATVVNGETMSLGASGSFIGSSTIPLPPASETSALLGNIIMSAFGAHPVATSSSSSENASSSGLMPFTGSGPTIQPSKLAHVVFGVTIIAGVFELT